MFLEKRSEFCLESWITVVEPFGDQGDECPLIIFAHYSDRYVPISLPLSTPIDVLNGFVDFGQIETNTH